MSLLSDVKDSLRVDDDDSMDTDIQDTIDACKKELELSGVNKEKIVDEDKLIVRAIKLYCKAEFSTDNTESVRYRSSFEALRNHLTLSSDYTGSESNA